MKLKITTFATLVCTFSLLFLSVDGFSQQENKDYYKGYRLTEYHAEKHAPYEVLSTLKLKGMKKVSAEEFVKNPQFSKLRIKRDAYNTKLFVLEGTNKVLQISSLQRKVVKIKMGGQND